MNSPTVFERDGCATTRAKRQSSSALLPALVVLAGCATYHPRPLPQKSDLTATPKLTVAKRKLVVPAYKPQPLSPGNGLAMRELVTLAVLNNPGLKAKRERRGIAAAQLLQAGLLPNPQLSANFIHPTSGTPPLFNGYSLGVTQSITAILTRGAKRAQAASHKHQVDLNVLWQEWQVAEQARQLYIQAGSNQKLKEVLTTQAKLRKQQYRRDQKALRAGNATLSTTSADLVGLVNARSALRQLERQQNKTRHKLNELVGLQPSASLELSGPSRSRPFAKHQFKTAIKRLPSRRPDLLALRAGYQSQQQAVRQAILGQFPKLSVGPTGGSDTSHVRTIGLGVTLSLPLFNRNQGQIAVARATRARLRQQYQARIDQAVSKAHKIWRGINIMQAQLQHLHARLPQLEETTDAAQKSFATGNMSAGTYINLRSSYLSTRIQTIKLEASMQQAQAALETLLGMTLSPADTKHPETGK